MRIERLDLIAFGPFTNQSLDFSAGESGLHLIYGDNEAGKSTSLRALIAWLFGIPIRTEDNYLHVNAQLRVGGMLRLSNGKELEFVRCKRNKDTLLKPDLSEVLDDKTLSPFLLGVDQNLFTKLYGVDHERLIQGGKDLLNQSGDLGQALFSAALGTANLRNVRSELQDEADKLFKSRGSNQLVNQAIAKFKESQRKLKESILPVSEWKNLQKELGDALLAINVVEETIKHRSKEKSRCDRLNRVTGVLAERQSVLVHIQELGQVLVLSEDFDDLRKEATTKLKVAKEAKERAEVKLSRLKEESKKLTVRSELLDNEEAILALYKELGAVEIALKDRPGQEGKMRLLRNEAVQLLKGIRPDLSIDDADKLRPLVNNKKWISSLAQKHILLHQKKDSAKSAIRDGEDALHKYKKELGELAQSKFDIASLKASVTASRKAGELEDRLAKSERKATDENSACEKELTRLGRFNGSLEDLIKVALPVPETLDRFERRFEEVNKKLEEHLRRQEEIETEKKQTKDNLEALLLTSNVPSVSELEQSRTVRNTGWNLIKQKYIEEKEIDDVITKYTSDSDLPTFYEKRVEDADNVSDRLRLAADQVLKRATFEAAIKNCESRLVDLLKNAEKTNEEKNALQKEWAAILKPLGIEPSTPREMKQWILKAEKLLTHIQSARAILSEANDLAQACRAHKKSLSLQISKFDPSVELKDLSLEAMITLCEQIVEHDEAITEQKRGLEKSISDAQARIERAFEDLSSIESDLVNWSQEWRQAIEGLGLKGDAHPEQATEAFEQLMAFLSKLDQSEDLGRRLYGIDQVTEKFKKKVFEFVDAIGFKRDNQEVTTIALQLNRDLNDAREVRASLKKIFSQEKEIKKELTDSEITVRTIQDQLGSLREQAGVQTDFELESAGDTSRKMRALRQKLATLEQELLRNGDGLSIAELESEASGAEVDVIEGDRQRFTSEIKELQNRRDELRDRRQTLQNDLKAKDGSAAAANASEDAEQQLAIIAGGIDQYLRLQIAALILEQQIETFRRANQTPVLSRAGEIFSRLTLNSFSGFRDELVGGKPILLGIRPDNKEVSVEGMSDGTRDQLYLSLRIATLEQHLAKGEPLPFIVDDILIGFDDNRSSVCLEILAELARKTEVLLFTHHRRVVELAKNVKAAAGVFVHELKVKA